MKGIRSRVLLLALVPLVAIVVLLSLHFIRTRLIEVEQSLYDRGQAIARQLAPACEYGVLAGNLTILKGLAASALRESDVGIVIITDMRDRPLVSDSMPAYAGTQLNDVYEALSSAASDAKAPIVHRGLYLFRAPIHRSLVALNEGLESDPIGPGGVDTHRQIGWVTVGLNGQAMQLKQYRVLAEGLAITLIGLLVTALVALRMARGVIRPLRMLTRAVERIKGGALDERVASGASGEIGQLEAGINAMAAALEAARDREKKRSADALFLEQVRAQVTLASIGDGVITTDARGMIVYINPVAEQFTGWSSDDARGRPLEDVFRIVDETTERIESYPLHYCLQGGRVIRHDSHHLLVQPDESRLEIQDSAAPIRDRDGSILGAVVVFRDVSEIQHMVRRMAFLASHDPLTGLLNRREFENRLQQVLESALNEGRRHALCYIDLDQFKIVNDTSGHVAGDELLKQLAHHLQKEIRASDILARLGGDEFGVILENCSMDKALQIAEILRQEVKEFRFAWQSRTFEVGASMGLVPITSDSGSLSELMSAADSACYVAKDHGRNRIHIYQPDDAALAQRHGEMQWVHRLRHGLDHNTFDLYGQAIVPLDPAARSTERFYEVLVRIQDRDMVSPNVFIPAAERYHLMPAIDRWVIYSTFTLLRDFYSYAAGSEPVRFAVNLSGQSLGDDAFLEFVLRQLEETGLDPRGLVFEVTETAAIANLGRARHFITQLKRRGCAFALDDFGSGLSSFGYLKSLPVDYLKIAGDFIRDIPDDPVDLAMVDAINQIGHVMGLKTIAESVESGPVIDKLRLLGVNYAQGVGLDKPRPIHEILELPAQRWKAVRSGASAALA